MYYNMNDIDIKSSNNLLRKVFLYMILGIAMGIRLQLEIFFCTMLFMGFVSLLLIVRAMFLGKNVRKQSIAMLPFVLPAGIYLLTQK